MDLAFEYAEKHALETEKDYPYTGVDGTCKAEDSKGKLEIKGFEDVTPNSPKQLMAALA